MLYCTHPYVCMVCEAPHPDPVFMDPRQDYKVEPPVQQLIKSYTSSHVPQQDRLGVVPKERYDYVVETYNYDCESLKLQ